MGDGVGVGVGVDVGDGESGVLAVGAAGEGAAVGLAVVPQAATSSSQAIRKHARRAVTTFATYVCGQTGGGTGLPA